MLINLFSILTASTQKKLSESRCRDLNKLTDL